MHAQSRPRERIYFTRFPDVVPPEVVSIHAHVLEAGRYLVVSWAWSEEEGDYRQQALVVAATLADAREYVPPGALLAPTPAEFALECWEVG